MNVTRRDRVLAAVNHQDTDIVPYDISLTKQARENLLAYVGEEWIERIGGHLAVAYYRSVKEVAPGHWRDHFGVTWNRTVDRDIGVVEEYLLPEPTLAGYSFPELDVPGLHRHYQEVIDSIGDRCPVATIGFSMFERAWTLRGMENLLMDMVAEPAFVDELLDAIADFHLRMLRIALEYPFDVYHFGDDWGQQKGLIMGPDHWRRFIKPRMARMFGEAKQAGRYVSLHCCGDIQQLFPDLIDIGLDIYQTFQPEIYDIHAVKREFGGDLTFWGGISTQRVLPWVSPEEVKRIAREMMSVMGAGGGYIAAPTHAVPGDVPPENIVALVEAFQKQK